MTDMAITYITLNTESEARAISLDLLKNKLAICTNWFPIQCAYCLEGEIKEEPEVVLLVKSRTGKHPAIEKIVKQHINYTNLIAEISVENANQPFLAWLGNTPD